MIPGRKSEIKSECRNFCEKQANYKPWKEILLEEEIQKEQKEVQSLPDYEEEKNKVWCNEKIYIFSLAQTKRKKVFVAFFSADCPPWIKLSIKHTSKTIVAEKKLSDAEQECSKCMFYTMACF